MQGDTTFCRSEINTPTYYYFNLDSRFWQDPRIALLEKDRFEYIVILLKLYDISLKSNGILIMPSYNAKDSLSGIAYTLRHEPERLVAAMKRFVELNLLRETTILDEKTEEIVQGFLVDDIFRKVFKGEIKNQKKDLLPGGEHEQLPSGGEDIKIYGKFKNVELMNSEFEEFKDAYKNWEYLIEKVSNWYHMKFGKDNKAKREYVKSDYSMLLRFAEKDGKLRADEETDKENKLEKKKKLWEQEARLGYEPPEEAKELLPAEEYESLVKIAEENN